MKKAYKCSVCGKEVVSDSSEGIPQCHGKPMYEISMEACREAGPEAKRPLNDEEPCEDFRGNQR